MERDGSYFFFFYLCVFCFVEECIIQKKGKYVDFEEWLWNKNSYNYPTKLRYWLLPLLEFSRETEPENLIKELTDLYSENFERQTDHYKEWPYLITDADKAQDLS